MKADCLLNATSLFSSERLAVFNCASLVTENQTHIVKKVIEVLSPNVVKALPKDWQGIDTPEKALKWLQERFEESELLIVSLKPTNEIVGFVFIHRQNESDNFVSLNIGYLFAEVFWGKGFASEVLEALVKFFSDQDKTFVLLAGVEQSNIASIRVLEKCGFKISTKNTAEPGNLFYELNL